MAGFAAVPGRILVKLTEEAEPLVLDDEDITAFLSLVVEVKPYLLEGAIQRRRWLEQQAGLANQRLG